MQHETQRTQVIEPEIQNTVTGTDYLKATGEVAFRFTNDYIFRIVFQENKYALKGLLCSVLHLKEDAIINLEITNMVKPGESITDKEYRMDVAVTLNDNSIIDLEMQLDNYNNWKYRSLSYLCREYDNLNHGDNYAQVKPAYQIGFLNFTLFKDHPEFFSLYQMRNAKDNHLFTDRFNLIVVSLNQEKLATSIDKAFGIDKWVRLFNSKTWEELKMVASDNTYMTSALESVYLSNQDKNVIKIARERDDFLRMQSAKDATISELQEKLDDANADIAALKQSNSEKDAIIARLQAQIDEKK